jgi:Domain of unknown function (DU1801)
MHVKITGMSESVTKPTNQGVNEFVNSIQDDTRRSDATQLLAIMQELTHESPVMWGTNIVGFGSYRYQYSTGRVGETLKIGFSPRKEHLVLYGVIFYSDNTELLDQLGKHKQGKGCLYIKKLSHINLDILKQMIDDAYSKPAACELIK